MIGKTLGPYEILEPLGAGGMGEVYLGLDPRLDRKVAIKVLPPEFAADKERLARFEQEAKAAAALNHPHIAAVFDIGFEDGDAAAEAATGPDIDVNALPAAGVHYMVQEYLEGKTLGDSLVGGALPIKKALALATEIGEALGAAHDAGIIHRDLKPANVFVAKDGHAKVLDFGLAKLTEVAPATDGSPSLSPTLLGTVAGQVMGTAGYMAPEQASGAIDIDHRADVFAFGSLLFEMTTGERAFAGRSIAETLALIQHESPSSISSINQSLPAELDRIAGKALEKDPDDRYQHTADLVVDLRALGRAVEAGTAAPASATSGGVPATAGPAAGGGAQATEVNMSSSPSVGDIAGTDAQTTASDRSRRSGLSWAVVVPVVVVVALLSGIVGQSLPRTEEDAAPSGEVVFPLALPENITGLPRGAGLNLSISADGRTIVFVGSDEVGDRNLYVRRLDDPTAVPIPNTENASSPKLSADGAWVTFQSSRGRTERILLEGGQPFEVCTGCSDVTWADDNSIYFNDTGSLYRMPVDGGERDLMMGPRPEDGVPRISRVHMLPGSRALVFEKGNYDYGGVAVLSLETSRIVHISPDGSEPFYSTTGHVLFTRGGTLFAVPFDVDRFEVSGAPQPVLHGVRVENAGAVQTALSRNGTLVYQPAEGPQHTQLVWVDRDRRIDVAVADRKTYMSPRLSPNGQRAAVIVNENGDTDVWVIELATGTPRQLTTAGDAANPVWTPDGTRIAYGTGADGNYALNLADATSGVVTELLASNVALFPMDFTPPDGDRLVFFEEGGTQDLHVLNLDTGTRAPLFETPASESTASLSADGKWLAYDSDRTGVKEIYVRAFPDGDEIPVSTNNGQHPVWSRTGPELLFQARLKDVFSASPLEDFAAFESEQVFNGSPFWLGVSGAAFDIAEDGRLLMIRHRDPADPADRLEVILNFGERLERLAPPER